MYIPRGIHINACSDWGGDGLAGDGENDQYANSGADAASALRACVYACIPSPWGSLCQILVVCSAAKPARVHCACRECFRTLVGKA